MAPDLQVRQAAGSYGFIDPARPHAEKVRCRARVQQRLGQGREIGALRRFARGSGSHSLGGSAGGSEAPGRRRQNSSPVPDAHRCQDRAARQHRRGTRSSLHYEGLD